MLIDSVSSSAELPEGAHLLMTEEICLAVSESHELAKKNHVSLNQMKHEKFIDLAGSASYAEVFHSVFERTKFTPQIAYSCDDYILQSKLISLGLGVSFVASVTWSNSYLPENVRLLHIDDMDCSRSIYYMPLGSFHSETQHIFEKQLENYFSNMSRG